MKAFHILPVSERAINFISMMFSYSGMMEYLPTKIPADYDSVAVVFVDNTLACAMTINGRSYEAIWNGQANRFERNLTSDILNTDLFIGYIGDQEMELLYNLFANKEPIIKGSKKAAIIDTNGVSDLVCTNCTLETLVADNSFFGKNPLR